MQLSGFGRAHRSPGELVRPRSLEEASALVEHAHQGGRPVVLRGAGRSYGDAATLRDGVALDLRFCNRILELDEAAGTVTVEPGATIADLWRTTLPRGLWPAVVPGTMHPTAGGCAAMNIHGKNNFAVGTFGDHVDEFDLLTADGTLLRASRTENEDLFHAAIGGFGMLGLITRLRLRLKRVHSGDLLVRPMAAGSIADMIAGMEARRGQADYLVGWVDVIGGGRGILHEARYLEASEDPSPGASLDASHQELPRRLLGVPRGWLWPSLWLLLHPPGMALVNAVKHRLGRAHARRGWHRQSLVSFSFLLDSIPGWERAYWPGGLVQYQSFVPAARAADVFAAQIELARRIGPRPYLGVLKRHRPDPFWLTHAVDGFSLALDFPSGARRYRRLAELARRFDELVLAAGGRFYFAKDSLLDPATWRRSMPEAAVARFAALKARLDPGNLFQSDLSRRVLAPGLRPFAVEARPLQRTS